MLLKDTFNVVVSDCSGMLILCVWLLLLVSLASDNLIFVFDDYGGGG
jgi:hypothetical protein